MENGIGSKFIKHFAIIGSGTFISMMIGFLTTPIITRLVSPTSYGQASVFLLYADMAVLLLYFGLDQAMVRYFYDYDSEDYHRNILFKCVIIPVITTVIVAVIAITFQNIGIIQFELGEQALYALCIYVFLTVVYRFAQLLVRLQYKTKKYSALNIIQKIIYVSTVISMIYLGKTGDTTSLIIGYIVAIAVCVIISIISEKKLWDFRKVNRCNCGVKIKDLITYAYPYVFTMGISTLFQAVDKISLNYFCDYEDVGIYTSAMTLIHVFAIVQTSFNTLWTPMAVEKYTKDPNDKQFFIKGNSAITVIMLLFGMLLILFKDIFALILGKEYRDAAFIIPFLIFNPVMFTISETTVTGIVLMKKSKMHIIIMIVPCIINLIGNAFLVPRFGCRGASISTGISYIVLFIMRTMISNRYFYIDYKLKKFYIVTIFIVIFAGISTFIPFSIYTIFSFFICMIVFLLLYRDELFFLLNYGINMLKLILISIKSKKGGI